MRDDPSTLELLKKVAFRVPWSLVERVTHLALAVVIGYWIGSNEKSEPEKQMQRVEARAAELLKDKSNGVDRNVGRRIDD